MGTTGHTITAGDIVPATINGESRLLTVARVTRTGLLYTEDWRAWWYRHPSHTDGESVHGNGSTLHTHTVAIAEPAPSTALVVLEGAAA